MSMKHVIACIFIKDGKAYPAPPNTDVDKLGDAGDFTRKYNDSGVDYIYAFNMAQTVKEIKENIALIKDICRLSEIPVVAAGAINEFSDIQEYLYQGCIGVVLNGSKPETASLIKDAAERFGAHKVYVSLTDVDILFKHKELIEKYVGALVVINDKIVSSVETLAKVPVIPVIENLDADTAAEYLERDQIIGVAYTRRTSDVADMVALKKELVRRRIEMNRFEPIYDFSRLVTDDRGLIPCIVQDYQTNDVLMMAYMNEESFKQTLISGKMTYWSRSRKLLWEKGETSGHSQYIKSLTTDCDCDTLLAKVSQIGPACHTGSRSCFFNEIIRKYYVETNPRTIFEDVYDIIKDRQINPREGSYTNYLIDHGDDKLLEKINGDAIDITLTAKNAKKDDLKFEISDILYHLMVLMAKNDVTWEDVIGELIHRE